MNADLSVTGVEREFPADIHIVATMDTEGGITFSNDAFQQLSGYTEYDLIGQNLSMARHPDMPTVVLDDLWQTLKGGRPWMGMTKNRCQNGDHYWVSEFVTPTFEGDTISGYESIGVKPRREWIERAEQYYRQLRSTPPSRLKQLKAKLTLGRSFFVAFSSLLLVMMVLVSWAGTMPLPWIFGITAVGLAAVALLTGVLLKPLRHLSEDSKSIVNNPIARKIYTGRDNEFGQIETMRLIMEMKLDSMSSRINDGIEGLESGAEWINQFGQQMSSNLENQQGETSTLATAMEQMTATAQEVAANASGTAEAATEAYHASVVGREIVVDTMTTIEQLSSSVQETATVIHGLEEESKNIGMVISVIRGIAEKTNLLALNAAIEAARAGDSGRGFAVVADEVRKLATHTHESTIKIEAIISNLQKEAQSASHLMESGCEQALGGVKKAEKAGEQLNIIADTVERINKRNEQMAMVAQQQSTTLDTLSGNISRINDAVGGLAEQAACIGFKAETFSQVVTDLHNVTQRLTHSETTQRKR